VRRKVTCWQVCSNAVQKPEEGDRLQGTGDREGKRLPEILMQK